MPPPHRSLWPTEDPLRTRVVVLGEGITAVVPPHSSLEDMLAALQLVTEGKRLEACLACKRNEYSMYHR